MIKNKWLKFGLEAIWNWILITITILFCLLVIAVIIVIYLGLLLLPLWLHIGGVNLWQLGFIATGIVIMHEIENITEYIINKWEKKW